MTANLITVARQIRLLLLDVDGVLTDGKLHHGTNGLEFKSFNTQDGHGIKMLQKTGVAVGIITGRTSDAVKRRAEELGINHLVQGREDKFAALNELLANESFALHEIAFLGDDWPDLSIMTRVGLPMAVANAHTEVLERAAWTARQRGGEGAVREACDWLMRAQGTYQQALAPYLGTRDSSE